jgi:hypothetical protein
VRPVLKARDGGVGGIRGRGDLLLSESELEASLAQVGRDWIGLTELSDECVFVAGVAIRRASPSASRCRSLSGLADGGGSVVIYRGRELIKSDKFESR